MKKEIEFEEIGQKTTYQVPDGFFERVSMDTLQKAKQREQKRRKNQIIWRTMAIAASLATLFFLSYYSPELFNSGTNFPGHDALSEIKTTADPSETIPNPVLVAESTDFVVHKKIRAENSVVELSTVLAEMTDDDLQQLATMYKNDLFLGESPQ